MNDMNEAVHSYSPFKWKEYYPPKLTTHRCSIGRRRPRRWWPLLSALPKYQCETITTHVKGKQSHWDTFRCEMPQHNHNKQLLLKVSDTHKSTFCTALYCDSGERLASCGRYIYIYQFKSALHFECLLTASAEYGRHRSRWICQRKMHAAFRCWHQRPLCKKAWGRSRVFSRDEVNSTDWLMTPTHS